jgi:hypothetical protein
MIGTHYLKVNREKISICLDSDINYYHHYKVGDIIQIEVGPELGVKLHPYGIENPLLTMDWNEILSARVPIGRLLEIGHLIDVTKVVNRDKLIDIIL